MTKFVPRKFEIQRAIQTEIEKSRQMPERWHKKDGEKPFSVWIWVMEDRWGHGRQPLIGNAKNAKVTVTPRTSYDETKHLAAAVHKTLSDITTPMSLQRDGK